MGSSLCEKKREIVSVAPSEAMRVEGCLATLIILEQLRPPELLQVPSVKQKRHQGNFCVRWTSVRIGGIWD